jgi:hypothetical protein
VERWTAAAALFACAACSAAPKARENPTDGGTTAPDAGSQEIDAAIEIAAPVPPADPALPNLGPCPTGWRTLDVATTDDRHATACDPFPEGGAHTCSDDQAHFPGEPDCAQIGTACPAGEYPEGLPANRRILYVRTGTQTGGDGTRSSPYATISDALAAARAGTIVAIGKGTFDEELVPPQGVTLWGACVRETILTRSVAVQNSAVVVAVEASIGVRNLAITGPRPGVWAPGGSARVEDVVIRRTAGFGMIATDGGRIEAAGVRITGTTVAARMPGAIGLYVGTGSKIRLVRGVIEKVEGFGLFAQDMGSTIAIEGTHVLDPIGRASSLQLGRGVHAVGSATIAVLRSIIEATKESAVSTAEMGSAIGLSDVVIRNVVGLGANSGAAIQVGEGASATAVRVFVEGAKHDALHVEGHGVLIAADAIVRDTGPDPADMTNGRALQLITAARASFARALFQRSLDLGVFAGDASTALSLTDVTIDDTRPRASDGTVGGGIVVQDGATATITRARIGKSHAFGLGVNAGSTIEASDLQVLATEPQASDGTLGAGLVVSDGSGAEIDRSLFAANHFRSVVVQSGTDPGTKPSRARLVDLIVNDTEPAPQAGRAWGLGVAVTGGSAVEIARVVLDHDALAAIAISGEGTTATISDAVVRDTQSEDGGGFYGMGLYAEASSRLTVERALVEGSHDYGAVVVLGSRARFEGLIVRGTNGADATGEHGYGLQVGPDSFVALKGGLFETNRGFGVLAAGEGAGLTAKDLVVRGTLGTEDRAPMPFKGTGIAALEGAHVAASGFESAHNTLCGVMIAGGSSMELEHGRVVDNVIGANVQVDGYPLDRLTSDVTYESNGVNLDSTSITVPNIPPPTALLDGS